jgi:hypothetical protein
VAVPTFNTGNPITSADLNWWITTRPLTSVWQLNTQSIPTGAYTAVTFDSETIDRYNMHSGSGTQVTIGLELGWYRVTAGVSWFSGAGGTYRGAVIRKNGGDISGGHTEIPNTGNFCMVVTGSLIVQATVSTDYVEVYAGHDRGSALSTNNGSGQNSFLSVEFLGT